MIYYIGERSQDFPLSSPFTSGKRVYKLWIFSFLLFDFSFFRFSYLIFWWNLLYSSFYPPNVLIVRLSLATTRTFVIDRSFTLHSLVNVVVVTFPVYGSLFELLFTCKMHFFSNVVRTPYASLPFRIVRASILTSVVCMELRICSRYLYYTRFTFMVIVI